MNKKFLQVGIILFFPCFIITSEGDSDRFQGSIDKESFSYYVSNKVGQIAYSMLDKTKNFAVNMYQELQSPKEIAKEVVQIIFDIANGPHGEMYTELIEDIQKQTGLK